MCKDFNSKTTSLTLTIQSKRVTGAVLLLTGFVLSANANSSTVRLGKVDDDSFGKSLTNLDLPSAEALTSGNSTGKPCNSSNLDTCWSKLPPLDEPGIPSTPAAVDVACKAFDTGMSCVEDWAKQCLGKAAREKVKSSVQGAHETFTFLCRDHKFRAEFLSHASCYRKISHLWDECAKRFIESLKRVDDNHEPITICCIRLRFLQCVTEVAHLHCSDNAAKFLQRMAETLVRSTMRSHVPTQCVSVFHQNCSDTSGSGPSLKPSISLSIPNLPVAASGLFPSLKLPIQYLSNFLSRSVYSTFLYDSFNYIRTIVDSACTW